MKVLKDIIKVKNKNSAVAVGIFDGLHIGHKKIINNLIKTKLIPIVFTMDFSRKIPTSKKDFSLILTAKERFKLLEDMGVLITQYPNFEDISNFDFVYFFEEILIKRLNMKVLCCGKNLKVGKKGEGNILKLQKLAEKNKVLLNLSKTSRLFGQRISSTRCRKELRKGNIKLVNMLLGHEYFFVLKLKKLELFKDRVRFYGKFPSLLVAPREGKYYVKVKIFNNIFFGILKIIKIDENILVDLLIFGKNIKDEVDAKIYIVKFLGF